MRTGSKMIALDEPTQKFLSILKALRIAAGVSREEIAEIAGTSKSDMKMYELGFYQPSLGILMRLAEYFSYDLSDSVNYKYHHKKLNPSEVSES